MKRDGDTVTGTPKPEYEAPVVVHLGELVRTHGASCVNGASATTGCHPGSSASGTQGCFTGSGATGGGCATGSST